MKKLPIMRGVPQGSIHGTLMFSIILQYIYYMNMLINIINIELHSLIFFFFPVPILVASDLIQAITLIIASFGFYSDFLSHLIEATGGE